MEHAKLKLVNRCLLVIILCLNAYVLLLPLQPAIAYEAKSRTTPPISSSDKQQVAAIDTAKNHLIIPSIRLDEPILDGPDPKLVHKGVWRRPNASTPDRGSNTVLVGHRFTYDGASVFYHLDKVKKGDELLAVWRGKIHVYKVQSIQTVAANALAVEDATSDDRLTIYTCTPLWSAKHRLVITGALTKTL